MSTKTSSAPILKLYYFGSRGRAETIRLTLAAAGKPFEDIRVTKEEWPQMKEAGVAPYGQLPCIEYKGKKYGESKAIASFVAKLCDMAGETAEDAMRVDEVYCLAGSLLEQMAKSFFETDPAKKAEMLTKVTTETIPQYLGFFERMLDNESGHFFLRALSMADLAVYDFTTTLLKKKDTALDKCPRIQKMREEVEKNPGVKAHLKSRPDTEY